MRELGAWMLAGFALGALLLMLLAVLYLAAGWLWA